MTSYKKSSNRETWSSPNPSTTVSQSRIPIFLPISRIEHKNPPAQIRRVETSWGYAELSGPVLTQAHRDILDAGWLLAERIHQWSDGSVSLYLDAYKMRKLLGLGNNQKRLIKRLHDLRDAGLLIRPKTASVSIYTSIITKIQYETAEEGALKSTKFGGGQLLEIKLSETYMALFQQEARVHDKEVLEARLKIEEPLIRALLRFMHTMNRGSRIGIKTALITLAAILPEEKTYKVSRAKKIIMDNQATLAAFGVKIDKDSIIYERDKRVFFTNPSPQRKIHTDIDAEAVSETIVENTATTPCNGNGDKTLEVLHG